MDIEKKTANLWSAFLADEEELDVEKMIDGIKFKYWFTYLKKLT